MEKWLFGIALGGTVALSACETSPPKTASTAAPASPAVSATVNESAVLEGVAVDAPIAGLPGATWSDPSNSGYVTGYTFQGRYHVGPPPGYDRTTHVVVNK